jgi:hypothetical protein
MNGFAKRTLIATLVAAALMSAGPLRASAPAGHFVVGSGTVFDTKTKLTWQQASSASTLTWTNANSYCKGLGGTWRLPTIKELLTLVDNTLATGPLIDTSAFPSTPSTWFWSSTPVAGFTTTQAWLVNFANGSGNVSYQTSAIQARCVHTGS